MKLILLIWLALQFTICYSQREFVGINDSDFELSASTQRKSLWCWAASIKMMLDYYGVVKTQSEIVERSFGRNYYGELPNSAGSMENISNNLNLSGVDLRHRPYTVKATQYNESPSPQTILTELTRKRPILVAYKSGPNMGHAVVITGCTVSKMNGEDKIVTVTVRDPWPSDENLRNKGVVEYEYGQFEPLIYYYWKIDVIGEGDVLSSKNDFANCGSEFCQSMFDVLAGFNDKFINIKAKPFDENDSENHLYRTNVEFAFPNSKNYVSIGEYPFFYATIYRGDDQIKADEVFESLLTLFGEAVPINTTVFERTHASGDISKDVNIRVDNDLLILISEDFKVKRNEHIVSFRIKQRQIKF